MCAIIYKDIIKINANDGFALALTIGAAGEYNIFGVF